jgi:hypothetical protein
MDKKYGFYQTAPGCIVFIIGVVLITSVVEVLALWLNPGKLISAIIIATLAFALSWFSFKIDRKKKSR